MSASFQCARDSVAVARRLLEIGSAVALEGDLGNATEVEVLPVHLGAFVIDGNEFPTLVATLDVDSEGLAILEHFLAKEILGRAAGIGIDEAKLLDGEAATVDNGDFSGARGYDAEAEDKDGGEKKSAKFHWTTF